jgi:hypothetical protein
MLLKTCSTVVMALACVALGATTTQAADMRHIDELAVAMRNDAARMANEIRYHFRGSMHYRHLYKDAYDLYQLADHVHELAHEGCEIEHLRSDLAQLDEHFHHLEGLVAKVNAEFGRPVVYDPHYGYDGHFHGVGGSYHTRRLNRLMASFEDNLHHLQEDINPTPGPLVVPPAAPVGPPVIVPPETDSVHFNFGKGTSSLGVTFRIK